MLPSGASLSSGHGAVARPAPPAAHPRLPPPRLQTAGAVASATPAGRCPSSRLPAVQPLRAEVAQTLQRLRLIDGVTAVTLASSTKQLERRHRRRRLSRARPGLCGERDLRGSAHAGGSAHHGFHGHRERHRRHGLLCHPRYAGRHGASGTGSTLLLRRTARNDHSRSTCTNGHPRARHARGRLDAGRLARARKGREARRRSEFCAGPAGSRTAAALRSAGRPVAVHHCLRLDRAPGQGRAGGAGSAVAGVRARSGLKPEEGRIQLDLLQRGRCRLPVVRAYRDGLRRARASRRCHSPSSSAATSRTSTTCSTRSRASQCRPRVVPSVTGRLLTIQSAELELPSGGKRTAPPKASVRREACAAQKGEERAERHDHGDGLCAAARTGPHRRRHLHWPRRHECHAGSSSSSSSSPSTAPAPS